MGHCGGLALEDNFAALSERGWAVRRGHRKRLEAPKRGKAGVRALARGQGAEVQRGRAVFSRSVNNGSQNHYWKSRRPNTCRKQLRMAIHETAVEELQCIFYEPREEDFSSENENSKQDFWDSPATKLEGCSATPSHQFMKPLLGLLSEDSESTLSLDSISNTSLTLPSHSSALSWDNERDTTLPKAYRWHLAVARAELAAKLYKPSFEHASTPQRNKTAKKEPLYRRLSEIDRKAALTFKSTYDIHIPEVDLLSTGLFEEFRKDFLRQHAASIGAGLRSCIPGTITLRSTPLANHVQTQFLHACQGGLQGKMVPTCHGTDDSNLGSIFARGLLIPGRDNGLRVANGSVHGLGVYTATAEAPSLAWSYARGSTRHLLVCGVLDDSFIPGSKNIKRVGNAVVVFDPVRVAPLFYARGATGTTVRPAASLQQPAGVLARKLAQLPQAVAKRMRGRRPKLMTTKVKHDGPAAFLARKAARKRRES